MAVVGTEIIDECFAPPKLMRSIGTLGYKDFVPMGLREISWKAVFAFLSSLFHVCKLLIEKGITERRWRVQFAGSVAETKIVS
jgi:hypothetical protein